MSNDSAWNLGAEIASKNIAARRARKEALSDEERALHVNTLYAKGQALSKVIPSLTGEHRDRAMKDLIDVEQGIAEVYHPDNSDRFGKGALQKDWHMLRDLIHKSRSPAAALTSVNYDPTVTPDQTITPPDQRATLAATPADRMLTPLQARAGTALGGGAKLLSTTAATPESAIALPSAPVTIPGGTTYNIRPAAEIMSPRQRQQMARRDSARQQAELDVSAGMSPEEEAQADSAKRLATVRQAQKDIESLPNLTSAQKASFLADVVEKTYGIASKPVWKEYTGPNGEKEWMDASKPEAIPPGWNAISPGAARGGGSDFWKTVTTKYGSNPTAAQIEAERQHWVSLGARGTETITTFDAAGNSRSIRVPTFGSGEDVPDNIAADTSPASPDAGGGTSPFAQAITNAEGFGPANTLPTRANNPGSLKLGNVGYGTMTAADGGQITVFGSPQEGKDALDKQLNLILSGRDSKYPPNMTLEQFGVKYSGGDADYGSRIAASLGVPPSTTLGQLATGGNGSADTAAAPASKPIRTPMTPVPVTPETQKTLDTLGLTPPDDPLITAPDNTADARAALATADRLNIGNDVRAVAEYRMPPPAITSGRGGGKQFMDLVQRVNPAYDATKWSAVQQARHSFTAGGLDAKNLQSLGLAVNHLDKLVTGYDALGNTDFPDANWTMNQARVRTGYGGVAAVDSAANAVSGEMAQVFKNSGATDQEITSWRGQFDHNMAPDAFRESVGTMTDLMAGRMLNEAQNYVNTFGSLKGFPLLAPKTVEILSRIDTDGAKQILEVNREAMNASGIKTPAPGKPTTAASSEAQTDVIGDGGGDDMIKMKLPDGRIGPIHRSQKEQFIKDHKGAVEVTQ